MNVRELLEIAEQTKPEDVRERFEQAWEVIHGSPLPVISIYGMRLAIDNASFERAALILFSKLAGDQPFRWTMTNMGYLDGVYQNKCGAVIEHPLSSGGGPLVQGFADTPGMAMLIAVLKAYDEWGSLNEK